jgi:ABC-type nitrate/sulfonate/bicarbonate transport system permease component
LVAITVFFLVLTGTLDGVSNVDRDLVRVLSLMGATRGEVIRKALVPASLPVGRAPRWHACLADHPM